jgi:hypothetical protein
VAIDPDGGVGGSVNFTTGGAVASPGAGATFDTPPAGGGEVESGAGNDAVI